MSETEPDLEAPVARHCGNCESTLLGPFCHQCGQPDKSPIRELFSLAKDGLEDFFSMDGKFFRSLLPLLCWPGALTREYLDGRRINFIRPFRLYLGISIALFLAINLFDDPLHFGVKRNRAESADKSVVESKKTSSQEEKPAAPGTAESDPKPPAPPSPPSVGTKRSSDGLNIKIGGDDWDPRTDPLDIPFLPDSVDEFVRAQLVILVKNGKQIEKDPQKLWHSLVERLPQSLFFLLPVFALLLKLMFIFKRRLYIEHLIVALHSHSFIFLCFLLMLTGNALAGLWPALATLAQWNWIILAIWIPIYLLVMQKRVYRQGWLATLFKYAVIGISYLILIGLTIILAFLLALRFMD